MTPAANFPDRESLCERCSYPLFGLDIAGDCPECGQPIVESSPVHRTGPPWQNRMTLGSWFATLLGISRRARQTFRAMRFDGSNLAPRMFLLSTLAIVGAYWSIIAVMFARGGNDVAIGVGFTMLAVKTVLVLTYIEILGVAFFSRRRGWRVGFRAAERIACYASPGWIIAAIVIAKLGVFWQDGSIERVWENWFGPWSPMYGLTLGAIVFAVAILGFETLVWLGVRQAKYANRFKPLAASRPLPDPFAPSPPGRSHGTGSRS